MKITLLSDDAVRFDPGPGPLTIEAPSAERSYSPFHMLGSSLAVCTHSLLYSWATHAKLGADDLAVEVRWTFAEKPHRIGAIEITLDWPSLPESRRDAATRAATLCPVHATLSHSPTLTTRVGTESAPVPSGAPVASGSAA